MFRRFYHMYFWKQAQYDFSNEKIKNRFVKTIGIQR